MKNEPGMAYEMKTLNKVFAVLSILFLMTVIWMMFDDYIRPWKGFQIKALEIKREVISNQVKELEKALDPKQVKELETKIQAAQKIVDQRKDDLTALQEELTKLQGQIHAEKMVNGDFNSKIAATTFQYEMALEHGSGKAKKLKTMLDEYRLSFSASQERLKAYQDKDKAIKGKMAELQKELTEAEKEKTKHLGAIERSKLAIKSSTPDLVMLMRNAPFLDYLDPTIQIKQVVMKNIIDDRYFQQVAKVDRCMTCHVFIDQAGYEKQKNPYKTHPNLELMVGEKSPHPMKSYGCTSCHGGEGHRVNDFSSAAHMPQNEAQAKEWKEKYNWHEPHKIPQPMLKVGQTEAACLKCHQGVERIPEATVLNEGRALIEKNGCYACHKIAGWEHLDKPGPSLKRISNKITKEFAKNWVWDPSRFNPLAKMPSFFAQTNNSDPESLKKNAVEVNTIVEFIWEISGKYEPLMQYKGGDIERGKTIISEVGCLGCHRVEGLDDQFQKSKNLRGPYLTGLGSKVDKDWLVSWIKQPNHYQPDTIMPSFRLSDEEVNDVAAYLLSLENKKFVEMKFDTLDKQTRDDLLIEYFSAFDTVEKSKEKLAQMDDRERTLELGKRSVGKYGCYSCHDIDGFEGRSPIGPELSKIGSKPVEQFGFGHEHIPHQRDAWITNHLRDPRRWDKGVAKSFKDLLKMPRFNLKEKEIQAIVVALLGQVADKVPLEGVKKLNANEALAERGHKILNKYNCTGCHQVDGKMGGEILKNYEDINEGPPRLVDEGHRVYAEWLHDFLQEVKPIRPWLKIRMPTFNLSNEDRNDIIASFVAKTARPFYEDIPQKVEWEPGEREAAMTLFKRLDCTSCHTKGFTNDAPVAPDLHNVHNRLRQSWIEKWLSNPQAIMEGTTMPAFWDGGSPEPEILGGDSEKQIRAVRKYLIELGQQGQGSAN